MDLFLDRRSKKNDAQVSRFEEAAREAGVDLDDDALKAALRQIGQHKPKADEKEKPDE